jgi:hypothetical protein
MGENRLNLSPDAREEAMLLPQNPVYSFFPVRPFVHGETVHR